MKILIVANFTRDFSETDNGRFLYLAKELSGNNEVEIVTSKFSHGKKGEKTAVKIKYPFKITMLDEPGYKKNISLKRFWSHYNWGKELRRYLKTIEKPDVVYCAIPSLTGPKNVAKYCKKEGIRLVIDIQDLWPEAFKMIFKVPILKDIVFFPFTWMANRIYSSADCICGVSKTYVERALRVNKKCKAGEVVFLGTNLDTFDSYAREIPIMNKPQEEIWIAYCGTLGSSYDLPCVFDALKILKEKGIRVKCIVMGDGPKRTEFENYALEKDIDVVFVGSLPYNKMCALLCQCDINVNPIMHGAAQSITNKHGDYAASGLPVVSTQENKEYRNLVEEWKMGFNCRNNDAVDLADKLKKLIENPKLRIEMGKNARRCAEKRFDRKNSYEVLKKAIINE